MNEISSILSKINKLIIDRNLTRSKLSVDLKVNRGTLYNILDGKSDLTVEFLLKCIDYLKLPRNYFIQENEYGKQDVSIDVIFDTIKTIVKEKISETNK